MSIESAKIDCDEDGFYLALKGDFEIAGPFATIHVTRLDLRLGQHAAIELLHSVRETIGEWHAEGEEVRADFNRWPRRRSLTRLCDIRQGESMNIDTSEQRLALTCEHGVEVNFGGACLDCESLAEDELPTPIGRIQLQELADNLRSAAAKIDELSEIADEELLLSGSISIHCQYLSKEKQQEFVRALGKCEKETAGSSLWVKRDFGESYNSRYDISLFLRRDEFCKPVVTGTRTVPAREAYEEEVVEWECGSILGS